MCSPGSVTSNPPLLVTDNVSQLFEEFWVMSCEDIEPLCRELLDAKAKTQPEEVEHPHEWITDDHRDGDSDE